MSYTPEERAEIRRKLAGSGVTQWYSSDYYIDAATQACTAREAAMITEHILHSRAPIWYATLGDGKPETETP